MIAIQLTLLFLVSYFLCAHFLILRKPSLKQSLLSAVCTCTATFILTLVALLVIKSLGSVDGRSILGSHLGSIASTLVTPVIATIVEIFLLKMQLRFGPWSAVLLLLLNLLFSGKVYIEFVSMVEPLHL